VRLGDGDFLLLTVVLSETTPQGKKKTRLAQTLLNGNNICMVCDILLLNIRVADVCFS
jgi:hypothetical protein